MNKNYLLILFIAIPLSMFISNIDRIADTFAQYTNAAKGRSFAAQVPSMSGGFDSHLSYLEGLYKNCPEGLNYLSSLERASTEPRAAAMDVAITLKTICENIAE